MDHAGPYRPVEYPDTDPSTRTVTWEDRAESLPDRPGDVKVTLNISPVQAGLIALLRARGFRSTRSSIIRDALERYFASRTHVLDRMIKNEGLELGYRRIDRRELEAAIAEGRKVHVALAGVLEIADDVDADLIERAFASSVVYGEIRGPRSVLPLVRARARP